MISLRKALARTLVVSMILGANPAKADFLYFRMYGGAGAAPPTPPPANSLSYTISGASSATVGQSYVATSQVGGVSGTTVFSLQSGALPSGTSLDPVTGVISGALSTEGVFDAVLKVRDGANAVGFAGLRVAVSPALVVNWFPAAGKIDEAYASVSPIVAGGRAPFVYSLTGSPPPGLVFQPNGLLTGIPTAEGSYSLAVAVVDADGRSASTGTKTVTIAPADGAPPSGEDLAITGTPGTESQVGVYYVSHFVASGGTSPYSFSLAAGELPHGLSLASDGTISGTPDTVGVASGLQVKVTDAASASALSGVFSITVSPQPQLLISGDPATSARVGENYTATFTAFDGSGAGYSFTLASGTLPPGLSLSTVDGVSARISGMPTHVGTYGDISIQVTDSRENTAVSQTFSITVAPVAGPALAVSGAPGPAEIGNAYSVSFMATGGTQVGYVFDIASGAVPSGLTLAANGTLSGIPDAAGTYSFSVRVADSSADTVSTTDSINVASPIQLAVSLPEAAQGTSYSYQLAPTGGQTPYSFAVTSGSLPSGLSLDQATGIISGAPSTVGTYPVTVQVTDSEGRSATAEASLIVYAPIQISGAPPAAATVGVAYFAQFSATGGNGKPSFAIASGALPAWLTLDSATGRLSGTPTAGNVGTVGPLKVSVTDGSRIALSAPFSISVATLPVMAGNPTQVTQGSAYSFDLATLTTGGTAPYAFSIKSGVLPTGMSRSASGGHSGNLVTASAVTGTTQTVTIHVVDAASRAGDYSMQFTVASPPTSNAWAWGNNSSGVYGNGTTNSGLVPVHVVGPDFVKVAIAANHACGITADGAAYCWGSNSVGQLGDGSGLNRLSPTLVSGLSSGVTDISVSNDGTTCAIQDGRGLCWGRGNDGQIGDGAKTDRSVPSQVSGLTSGVTSISAGQSSIACAVQAGAAKCWGNNGLGSIGDNTFTNRLTPVQVSGLTSGVTAVAAGTLGACAIVSGAAKCWGYNGSGQIGDGTTTNRAAPVQVSGLTSGVTQISMSYNGGSDTTCAVVSGAAKCWGYNGNGQIGDGTNTQRLTPTQVNGLTSGVTSVSVGKSVGCAVVSGSVKCWGANSNGQIGNGTTSTSLTPVQTTNLTSGISEISVGQQAVIAR